jgi:hypothetical protein
MLLFGMRLKEDDLTHPSFRWRCPTTTNQLKMKWETFERWRKTGGNLLRAISGGFCYTLLSSRVTRCACEKVAQNVAKSIFVKITHKFYRGKR